MLGDVWYGMGFVCAHDLGFRAYLSELIVAEEKRGRGVGKALVERVQAELAQRGRVVLIADVGPRGPAIPGACPPRPAHHRAIIVDMISHTEQPA